MPEEIKNPIELSGFLEADEKYRTNYRNKSEFTIGKI